MITSQVDIDENDPSAEYLFREALRAIDNRGWLRIGTGSNATDNIYYMVLPDYRALTPTAAQYSEIENFINLAYLQRRSYVIIYFSPYDFDLSKTFFFDDYAPEDLMKIVRRYYTTGRIREGLKEDVFDDEEDDEDEGENIITKVWDYVENNITNEDIINIMDGEVKDFYNDGHAYFLAPDGTLMNVQKAINESEVSKYLPDQERAFHVDFVILLSFIVAENKMHLTDEQFEEMSDYDWIYERLAEDYLDYTRDKGLIRLNTGAWREACYAVLPNRKEFSPTKYQWWVFEDYLDYCTGVDNKVLIYFGDDTSKTFKLSNVNEIVKTCKRYYSSGNIYENLLNEVYPNKGEGKKDFIARFMEVTKDEYPDVK